MIPIDRGEGVSPLVPKREVSKSPLAQRNSEQSLAQIRLKQPYNPFEAMSETEIIFSYQGSPEGGYEARAIGHSIFTQAETMDELMANVIDAVACHFGDKIPLPVPRLVARPKSFVLGSAKGEFTVPDDFNDPDPEIEDLFYNGPLLPE
jgi:hypothetical protein